jgi:plasmid stability protein
MTVQPVTVHVPEPLYEQLRERALQHHRSVAEEVLEVLTSAVPIADTLPDDLEQAIAHLPLLQEEALWDAARSRLAPDAIERLQMLNLKRQREGLTEAEITESDVLVRQYEHTMLVRARAAALLKEQGHDVSILLNPK